MSKRKGGTMRKYTLLPSDNFLQIPNYVFTDLMKNMKPTEFSAFLVLFFLHRKFRNVVFSISDKRIHKKFGISPASMQRARKALKSKRLIAYKIGFSNKLMKLSTKYKMIPEEEIRELLKLDVY